jgi:hypothetical protein
MKTSTEKTDKWKGIPITLAPPQLALSDTPRLLITLALIGGHLEGVVTWSDLLHRDIGPKEVEIGIKATSLGIPIFYRRHGFREAQVMSQPWICMRLRKLGKLAGFEIGLSLYVKSLPKPAMV